MLYSSPFKKVDMGKEVYNVDDIMQFYKSAIIGGNEIFSFNGLDKHISWNILNKMRKFCEDNELGPHFPVVKTDVVTVRFSQFSKFDRMDLVRGKERKIFYWFEFKDVSKGSPWISRRYVEGFEALAYTIGEDIIQELKVIIPCGIDEYDSLRAALENADSVKLSGMLIDCSSSMKKEQDRWFVPHSIDIVDQDFSGANNILSKMKEWQELIPMRHFSTSKPLFSESIMLSMMVSVLFTRKSAPVFDTVFFGPSDHGKSSVLSYLVKDIMQGKIIGGSTSSGKGWLVSHAKDSPQSVMFSEKNVLMVNEMFKFVSQAQGNAHSYVVQLKLLMEHHMEILERNSVEGRSGLGQVSGRMVCSFLGIENDDDHLIRGLGRVFCLAPANTRRFQIIYAARDNVDEDDDVNSELARRNMNSKFCTKFGRTALRDMKSLYLYSRRFTEDVSLEAPVEWKKKMRELLQNVLPTEWMADSFMPNWFGAGKYDETTRKEFDRYLGDFIRFQKNTFTPCYISAAIIRGWEVYDSIDTLQPVFDERQEKMAEKLVKLFAKCKLRIFAKGIEEHVLSGSGISRVLFGGQ
jgi:hypothetical protein